MAEAWEFIQGRGSGGNLPNRFESARYVDDPDPQPQQAVDDAVAATTTWYREQLDTVIAKVFADLKAKGVAVNTVDTAPFQAMVDPVYADFAKQWGADFVQSVRKAASGG